VDTKKLLEVSEMEFDNLDEDLLLECLVNRNQVEEIINNPKLKFKGPMGPILAAISI